MKSIFTPLTNSHCPIADGTLKNARLCLLRHPVEIINIGTNFNIGKRSVNPTESSCIILGSALFREILLEHIHDVVDGWHTVDLCV